MNKGILIIGGGILQERAIFFAKKLGFEVHLVDGNSNCYCRNFVKNFYLIDCNNYKKIALIAKHLKKNKRIHGVYTQGADFAVTVSYVAKKLDFTSVNLNSAKICKNKFLLRKFLTKHKLSSVKFFKVSSLVDLKNKIKKIDLPAYLKPVDNSASRGVCKISHISECEEAFDFSIKNCSGKKLLILEEEIIGPEISVDTIIYNNKFYRCGISDRKFKRKNKFAVQYASITPTSLNKKYIEEAYSLMEKASKILKINQSAFKGDLVLDSRDKKIKIIELTPRLSGGFDAQYRKLLSFGINLIKVTMFIAMNIKFDCEKMLRFKKKEYSSTFSVLIKDGFFHKYLNLRKIKKITSIKKIFLLSKKGDIIKPLTNCSERNNFFICLGKSFHDLLKVHKKIKFTLKFKYL